jgi:hypothetical protein
MINNETTKKKKLKRIFRCQIELGPYLDIERKRYAFWCADLDKGAGRVLTVVQLVRDPKHLGNEKRNPVLYRNILDASRFVDSMDVDKWVLISGGNALYHIVDRELRKISRPLVAISGYEGNGSSPEAYWQPFEVGHGTETLQVWREQVLYVLEHKYCVYDQTETLAWLKPHHQELYGDVLTEEILYQE